MFEEVEASEEQLAASKLLLQEYAGKFCNDGEKWIESSEVSEEAKKRCLLTIEDWLAMRRATREESHILLLNRVGIERDEQKKRENVAKHVGLAMPKEYKQQWIDRSIIKHKEC